MAFLILIGFFFLVLCYSAFSWGFVIHKFYGYFVLSAIPSLPHFDYVVFVGFSLFLNALIRHTSPTLKDEYLDKGSGWLYTAFAPWFVLVFGWAVHAIWFS